MSFQKPVLQTRYAYALGTVGRDMIYILVTSYLLFYMTDILTLPNTTIAWITFILLANRLFDAFSNPVMGMIIDNTRSRYGKFKPWIAIGGLLSALFSVLLFVDSGLRGSPFVILFALLTVLWEISYTANDIAYWSMFPVLTDDPDQRSRIAATARNCANAGRFFVIITFMPLIQAVAPVFGGQQRAALAYVIASAIVMLACQCFTLFGVRERYDHGAGADVEKTAIRDLFRAIFHNDQLLVMAASMTLFTIGYTITTGFGLYFFKYAYGDASMFSTFSIILAITQFVALALYPAISRRLTRRTLFLGATILSAAGMLAIYFSPMDMRFLGPAGIALVGGQAFTQVLALLFLTDTVDYGQRKLGQRHESVVFSVQPFINKISNSAATGVVGATIVLSGINDATDATDVTPEAILTMKLAMLILPLVCVIASYAIYRRFYHLDGESHGQALAELAAHKGNR